MSQENVEVVKQALDAYVRRDLDAVAALSDRDVEVDWSRSVGWIGGVYRGIDEVVRFYTDYLMEVFDAVGLEAQAYTSAGDSVVVPNVVRLRGRQGIEVTARNTLVFTLRNGKLARICLYQDIGEALKAVGLEG